MSSNLIGTSDKELLKGGLFLPVMEGLRQSYFSHFEPGRRILQRLSLQDILFKNTQYITMLVATGFSSTEPSLKRIEKFWTITKKYPVRRLVIQSSYHIHRLKSLPSFVPKEDAEIAECSLYAEERMDSPLSVTNRVGLYPYLVDKSHVSPYALVIIRPDLYVVESKLIYTEADLEKAVARLGTIFN